MTAYHTLPIQNRLDWLANAYGEQSLIASDLRAASEEIKRLRGEMRVICALLFEADDVIATIEPENDDEHEKLSALKQKIHDALLQFQLTGNHG